MPQEWQARFVKMLDEIEKRFDDFPERGTYEVNLKDGDKELIDPLASYERGRRLVDPKGFSEEKS